MPFPVHRAGLNSDIEAQDRNGSPTSAIATTEIQNGDNILFPEDVMEDIKLMSEKDDPVPPSTVDTNRPPNRPLKLLLLCTLSIQTTGYVLLGRYTRSSVPAPDLYDVKHLVLLAELVKFFISCTMEQVSTDGHLLESLHVHVYQRPLDSLKPALPALLFVLQNALAYTALTHLSAPFYLALSQGKLITTVMASGLLLQRKYNCRQWICVTTLSAGVALILASDSSDNAHHRTTITGFLAVVGACFCSAFASVYFEGVMKRSEGSLWLRNIQLSFFGIITTGTQSLLDSRPLCQGFSTSVWALVLMQAGGGLLTAAVMKHCDNVMKGLAFAVSVVLTSVASSIFFDVDLSRDFLVGASVILTSVYFFSNPCNIVSRTT